jgi:hypothetical protein
VTAGEGDGAGVPFEGTSLVVLRLFVAAGVALAALVAAGWALLAVAHVDDRYHVNHVTGVWLALARHAARTGTPYPPLHDEGTAYGGTRLMPLQIEINGAAARLSGDVLASSKVVAYLLAAVLLVLLFATIVRFGCGRATASILCASVLASTTGILAATTMRGDTLPVILQVAALVVISRRATARGAAVAAVLCAGALLGKFSAVWAAPAIVVWLLLLARPRHAAVFAGAFAAALGAGVGCFALLSDGRLRENVAELATAGESGGLHALLAAPSRIAHAAHYGDYVLLVLAASAVVAALVRRRAGLYELALVFAAVALLVIFSDTGADTNHLLDVTVLSTLVVGRLLAGGVPGHVSRVGIAAALALGLGLMFETNMRLDVEATLRGSDSYSLAPIRGYLPARGSLLSEDASIPVQLGRRPVVLDAFMLARLGRRHPAWIQELARRIDRRGFDRIVLLHRADGSAYFRDGAFGLPVGRAVARSYRLLLPGPVRLGGPLGLHYWVYAPKPPAESG